MDILNVGTDSTAAQIKSAYRKLVLEHHPDRKSGDDRLFRKITEAYHILTDTEPAPPKDPDTKPKSSPGPRSRWGAGPQDKVPEEDWSRYTSEFEEDKEWWHQYETRFWEEYEGRVRGGGPSRAAREPNAQPRLKVDVDQSLCIGCCSCETIAPNVFELARNVKANPKSHVKNPRGAGINTIMNAAETCPTKAILVDNLDTGERLYPF